MYTTQNMYNISVQWTISHESYVHETANQVPALFTAKSLFSATHPITCDLEMGVASYCWEVGYRLHLKNTDLWIIRVITDLKYNMCDRT